MGFLLMDLSPRMELANLQFDHWLILQFLFSICILTVYSLHNKIQEFLFLFLLIFVAFKPNHAFEKFIPRGIAEVMKNSRNVAET